MINTTPFPTPFVGRGDCFLATTETQLGIKLAWYSRWRSNRGRRGRSGGPDVTAGRQHNPRFYLHHILPIYSRYLISDAATWWFNPCNVFQLNDKLHWFSICLHVILITLHVYVIVSSLRLRFRLRFTDSRWAYCATRGILALITAVSV